MTKAPTPKADALRKMREQKADEALAKWADEKRAKALKKSKPKELKT
jgi:hypothetical protein